VNGQLSYPEAPPHDSGLFRGVVEFLNILDALDIILDLVLFFVCFLDLL
jgi:hypothetical protein